MCGIVGLASTVVSAPKVKAFKTMLVVDTIRGWDSTGVACIRTHSRGQGLPMVATYKRALAGPDFVQTRTLGALMDQFDKYGCAVIGHNRAATRGAVMDDTAHPFTHGDVTLVHNGSLFDHRQIGGGNTFDVDSEAVCWAINQCDGDMEAVSALLNELDGAFALVWYNKKAHKLYFARNDERPLHIGDATFMANTNTPPTTVFWGSMPEFVSIGIKTAGMTAGSIESLTPGRILSLDCDKISFELEGEFDPAKKPVTGTHWGSGTTTSSSNQSSQNSAASKSGRGSTEASKSGNSSQKQSTTPSTESTNGSMHDVIPAATGDWIEARFETGSWREYKAKDDIGYSVGIGFVRTSDKTRAVHVIMHSVPKNAQREGVWRAEVRGSSIVQPLPDGLIPISGYNVMAGVIHVGEPGSFKIKTDGVRVINPDMPAYSRQSASRPVGGIFEMVPEFCAPVFAIDREEEQARADEPCEWVGGRLVSRRKWDQLTKHGCSHCSADLDNPVTTFWINGESPLCAECASEFAYNKTTH